MDECVGDLWLEVEGGEAGWNGNRKRFIRIKYSVLK